MSKFADYSHRRPRGATRLTEAAGLAIRPARVEDLPDLAAIAAEREEEDVEGWRSAFARIHQEAQKGESAILLTAALGGRAIGYGKAAFFDPPPRSPADVAPAGWYLTGVVIKPEFRRRGVGIALTAARLAWIRERATRAYYFANERNRASIDLHRALGFIEMTRDFQHPGARFQGGSGVLFVCDLEYPAHRDQPGIERRPSDGPPARPPRPGRGGLPGSPA